MTRFTFIGPYLVPIAPRITIAKIQSRVCEYYGIHRKEMTSGRRAREVARPRQVAMYLSRNLTPHSLPQIGRYFGGRDHTTVMHAIRAIDSLRSFDNALDGDVRWLKRNLEASA